jgi:hypothetical protein
MMRLWRRLLESLRLKKRLPSLQELDPETIRRERIRIEQTEQKIAKRIEELEGEKAALFTKGVGCTSDRQRMQIARKIKELDGVIRSKDQMLAMISKNQRVLQGMAQIKDLTHLLGELGMEGLVGKMDLVELQSYIEQTTVEGQFQIERFAGLVESLDGAEAAFQTSGSDDETLAIMEAMSAAGQRSVRDDEPAAGENTVREVSHESSHASTASE